MPGADRESDHRAWAHASRPSTASGTLEHARARCRVRAVRRRVLSFGLFVTTGLVMLLAAAPAALAADGIGSAGPPTTARSPTGRSA